MEYSVTYFKEPSRLEILFHDEEFKLALVKTYFAQIIRK